MGSHTNVSLVPANKIYCMNNLVINAASTPSVVVVVVRILSFLADLTKFQLDDAADALDVADKKPTVVHQWNLCCRCCC